MAIAETSRASRGQNPRSLLKAIPRVTGAVPRQTHHPMSMNGLSVNRGDQHSDQNIRVDLSRHCSNGGSMHPGRIGHKNRAHGRRMAFVLTLNGDRTVVFH
jgi:hypothetical protein